MVYGVTDVVDAAAAAAVGAEEETTPPRAPPAAAKTGEINALAIVGCALASKNDVGGGLHLDVCFVVLCRRG